MNPPRTEADDKLNEEDEANRNDEEETTLLHDDDAAASEERTPLAAVVAWKAVAMEAMIASTLGNLADRDPTKERLLSLSLSFLRLQNTTNNRF